VLHLSMAQAVEQRIHTRHRNVLILLWVTALLLLLLTWGHVYVLASESRQREISGAERDLANLTRLSQEHAVRTFRSADQVIRFVQSRYLEQGNKLDLAALTRQGVIDAEIFNQVGIIDANGIYALANRPITSRLDLSDREHFKVHVHQDSGQLFVSRPVIGRATGKWSLQLTRRINKPDGSFGGVVVLSIDPAYFTGFYGELNLGPGGLTALYGLDGIARARRVGDQTGFDTDASHSALFEKLIPQKPSGSYVQESLVDGVERLYFYRTVPRYSMLALAAVDMRFLMVNHDKALQALLLQAGLVSLLILVLLVGLSRYLGLLRRDTVARKLAQVQIQERTAQLNAVFDISPDGFVSFDQNRCVTFVNPAFSQMTGLDSTALQGMAEDEFSDWLAGLCEPAPGFIGLKALRSQEHEKPGRSLETIELQGGGQRILQVQLRLSASSTVSQILSVRDITHETEVEALKSEFLATAAHELRTPMASIYGFAEVLLTQQADAVLQKEFLGIILKQSRLMVDILNELLDLARIEARRGKDFKFTELNLQYLLTDLITSFPCPEGRVRPELDAPKQPVTLRADAGKLRQALLNVLSNAYKYSPDGGAVHILVELKQQSDRSQRVAIHISDHGMGMTADQAARVFTRFYRADTSGRVPGTGLGMSITKEIVEHHRGSISIISAPGEGTQVTLILAVQVPGAALPLRGALV
jgi:PAS domain S-box-containing protein